MSAQWADHPHSDPGDGRSECPTCGKWIWPILHSCKGIRVTDGAYCLQCSEWHEYPETRAQEPKHTRGYAGRGPDDDTDRGAFCVECSAAVEEYVWPCAWDSREPKKTQQ